jgi:23S rRNA (guanosine2251-2'-O)-methyltransferase
MTKNRPIPDRQERQRLMTLYGRKAVLEALEDPCLDIRCLHLASSNRPGDVLQSIQRLAESRDVEARHHSREELARISRNGRQDQGVALDIRCPSMRSLGAYLDDLAHDPAPKPQRLLALDGVTNPQNMGMALRSATAAGVTGILYSDRGNPALGPLVIKASAGTVFRAPILRCQGLANAARELLDAGFTIYRLDAQARTSVWDADLQDRALFVLGGETDGVSAELRKLPGKDLSIPMANGVESLNVAVTAALVAFAIK